MLEFRFRYSISFSPDDLSAMRILVLCVIRWSLYWSGESWSWCLSWSWHYTGLSLSFGLGGVGFGLGNACVDYNTVWY